MQFLIMQFCVASSSFLLVVPSRDPCESVEEEENYIGEYSAVDSKFDYCNFEVLSH
jgi:hypothetical protein